VKPLRIAVDVTPLLPGGVCGGAKPFVLELLSALVDAPTRHEYQLLTAPHNHEAFASYDRAWVSRRCLDGSTTELGLRAEKTDLLFCPMTAPTYAEAGVRTVSVLYDLQHLTFPWFFSGEELAHRNAFYRALIERADHVVCISEFSQISLIRHLGATPARTTAVPIAIQNRLPAVDADVAWDRLARLGVRPCRFAFYPANFWPHKNHRLLLMAFGRFAAEHPEQDLHLVLSGDALNEGATMRAVIEQMGLADRVHILGFVSDDDLAAVWTVATVLVFPSLFEGFGIPLTEAMYYGKPIVCSRAGSLPEVGGEEAFYFDARNPETLIQALLAALENTDDVRQRVARGRERLAAYDPGRIAERYLEVFAHATALPVIGTSTHPDERHADGTLLMPHEAYASFLETRLAQAVPLPAADPASASLAACQLALAASEAERARAREVMFLTHHIWFLKLLRMARRIASRSRILGWIVRRLRPASRTAVPTP
jgi:glycosyltransferase involved in cell wall biosynthesis